MADKALLDTDKLKSCYGILLEDLDFMVYGCSERLLPYPKEDIETFFIQQGVASLSDGDKRAWDFWLVAYMLLANFLPYEKYNQIKAIYLDRSKLTTVEDQELTDDLARITQEISNDTRNRAETFIRRTAASQPGSHNFYAAVQAALVLFRSATSRRVE